MASRLSTPERASVQPPVLELSAVRAAYRVPGRAPVVALHGVDARVNAGEIVGLLGHNGAGKTTLMRVALGMVRPTGGLVRVCGLDPGRERHHVLRSVGAILDGERDMRPRWKVIEVLEFAGVAHGTDAASARRRANELLDHLGFAEGRERLVTQLSRGMRQKLSLALALMHRPSLLILDEPILGLDVATTAEFLQIASGFAADGHAVLISSHQLNTLEPVLDRVVLLRGGHGVFDGSPEALIEQVGSGKWRIRFDNAPSDLPAALPAQRDGEDGAWVVDNDTEALAAVFAAAAAAGSRLLAMEPLVDLEAAYLAVSAQEGPP